jgi:hypothetical protein
LVVVVVVVALVVVVLIVVVVIVVVVVVVVAGANAALQADTHPPLQSSCAATPAKLSITHLMPRRHSLTHETLVRSASHAFLALSESDPIFALASTLHGAAFASPQPLPMQ